MRRKDEYDVFTGFRRYGLIWANPDPGTDEAEPAGAGADEPAAGLAGARDLVAGLWARRAAPVLRSRRGLIPVAALLVLGALAGALAIGAEEPASRMVADRAHHDAPGQVPGAAPSGSARPVPPARAPAVPRGAHGKVVLLDQSKVPALAQRMARRLEAAGWEVTGTDVFRGVVPATTVYHPADQEKQARALAADLPGIGRIKPTFPGIPHNRLTVIVVDDQAVPLADRLLGSLTTR
ncbi:LytR C-terminal domain-containing protein [Embleya sp. NBC_00896]|uniref:LytR C-terminal domain-containing protein n=1 Tax=Embleya sp. NBC_00896 TaxID=2975961 RepID=UPI00386A3A46|nr:LytR C-terminal domain-containing protein [Embleya sp. NBC_00896]